MAERRTAQPQASAKPAVDPLAEVEAMILRLRQREPGKERRADYGLVIDPGCTPSPTG
jgi:hypothetical protein